MTPKCHSIVAGTLAYSGYQLNQGLAKVLDLVNQPDCCLRDQRAKLTAARL
jgi:hypothetical protein